MPVTNVTSASLSPASPSHAARGARIKRTVARKVVTAPPFTPAAQKQANAINTGRQPSRGARIDIKV